MRVGFIGLSRQRTPMARRIAQGGHDLRLWVRCSETIEALGDIKASIAVSPADLAAESELVGICIRTDADVEEVLTRSDGMLAGIPSGGTVAIHSTVHPRLARGLPSWLQDEEQQSWVRL